MTEPATPETVSEPAAQEPEHAQEGSEGEAAATPEPDAAPAEPDHAALLEELAEHIRSIAASGKKDIYEAVAWLASHGL